MEHLRENEPVQRNNNVNNNNQNNNGGGNINGNNHNNNIDNNHHHNNNNNNNNRNNFNNLNYNRFRHVLRTHELEFVLNKKYSRSLWEKICNLTFTKNCHKISFSIILFLTFWVVYFFTFMNYKNSSIITKLESEDSYFEIIIWMIIIAIIIITWNFYLFLYLTIFKYDYSKNTNKNLRTSFVEDCYKNPFGFLLLLYYYDNQILKNVIDNSFWALLGFEYAFAHYHLNQFYIQFYKELNSIDFKNENNKLLKKANLISIFFLLTSTLLIMFNYMIIEVMSFFHKFIFLSKGMYLIYKIIEIWKIFLDEYNFLESNMNIKEKIYFKNLRTKSFLELGGMIYVYFQIIILVLDGDNVPFYFNIFIIYFIIVLGLQIISYYKKYKELRDYFLSLDKYLKKIENINEDDNECVICTEKMTTARNLECNHNFHLICLSKWFENGHNSCPICRKEIKFSENFKKILRDRIGVGNNNEQNQYRNRIFSFSLNSNLFSLDPNFSLRIIRFYNNNENNGNNIIINNNQNIDQINLNFQRANNNNQRPNQN